MKTVVIDGVEYELLQSSKYSAWRTDNGARDLTIRPLPKPKKTILDRANELFDGDVINATYSSGAVALATEERIAALESRLEALEK